MMENYLSHSGRKGQKWGVKNGPPYPLDYSKMSPEEREHHKGEAIKTGNIYEANKNVKYFSNKEIDDTINRYKKEAELHGFTKKELERGKKTIDDLIEKGNKFVKFTNMGMNVYDSIAKMVNVSYRGISGTNDNILPLVNGGNYGKKKGNNNNNNNRNDKDDD